MVEYIILIIAGLVLDICGVFLIIKPVLYFRGVWTREKLDFFKKDYDDQIPEIKINRIKMAWWGVIFLVVGFSLQIAGNYLQYQNLNS